MYCLVRHSPALPQVDLEFTKHSEMALNSQLSSCLNLLLAGIIGDNHHAQLYFGLLYVISSTLLGIKPNFYFGLYNVVPVTKSISQSPMFQFLTELFLGKWLHCCFVKPSICKILLTECICFYDAR